MNYETRILRLRSGGWGAQYQAIGVVMKDNCRSFVVRRGGLLWMTSVFVGAAHETSNPVIMNSQVSESRPG
jgi:hypothetical protein